MSLNDIPSFYSGDTQNIVVNIVDENGNAVDLSGSTFKWEMVMRPTSLIKDSSLGEIVVTDTINGILQIKLLPEDSQNITGVYSHELQMTDAQGDITTVLQDKIRILKSLID